MNLKRKIRGDTDTFMATHLVKIKLDGDLRIMEIPSPPRFDGLVKAVMEAYTVPSGKETELTFTYRDNDGDEVRSATASSRLIRW